jgi:hypothetical protein
MGQFLERAAAVPPVMVVYARVAWWRLVVPCVALTAAAAATAGHVAAALRVLTTVVTWYQVANACVLDVLLRAADEGWGWTKACTPPPCHVATKCVGCHPGRRMRQLEDAVAGVVLGAVGTLVCVVAPWWAAGVAATAPCLSWPPPAPGLAALALLLHVSWRAFQHGSVAAARGGACPLACVVGPPAPSVAAVWGAGVVHTALEVMLPCAGVPPGVVAGLVLVAAAAIDTPLWAPGVVAVAHAPMALVESQGAPWHRAHIRALWCGCHAAVLGLGVQAKRRRAGRAPQLAAALFAVHRWVSRSFAGVALRHLLLWPDLATAAGVVSQDSPAGALLRPVALRMLHGVLEPLAAQLRDHRTALHLLQGAVYTAGVGRVLRAVIMSPTTDLLAKVGPSEDIAGMVNALASDLWQALGATTGSGSPTPAAACLDPDVVAAGAGAKYFPAEGGLGGRPQVLEHHFVMRHNVGRVPPSPLITPATVLEEYFGRPGHAAL